MISALLIALASPSAEPLTASACEEALENVDGGNVLDLATGLAACEEEERVDDTAFLDLLIRIRMAADLTLLPPMDGMALAQRGDLAEALGGRKEYVDAELARDRERFERLLERASEVNLLVAPDYDPGWQIGDSAKRGLYAEVVQGIRDDQIQMERYVARLVRDEEYYAAYVERVAMLADLSANGSRMPDRFGEVTKIMQARRDVLGEPPTFTAVPWRKVYEPGPETSFTVLHRGFNGAAQREVTLFRSPDGVNESWVVEALTSEQLASVLSQVDFESEVLGLYAVGEMINATGNFFVTEFSPEAGYEGHSITVRVGVSGPDCGTQLSASYPFALVKTQSQNEGDITSQMRANYPDQCSPVMIAQPTATGSD